jgi:peptidyl-prolyl cis-trans isomerase B (cyclophilin B)
MAKDGMYDSTTFYRVIKGFMIQGGDVASKPGFSNESERLISAEIKKHHLHAKGALAAARKADNVNPERESSTQFYIVQGRVFTNKEMQTDLVKLNYAARKYLQRESNLGLRDTLVIMQEKGQLDEIQRILINLKEEIAAYTELDLDKKPTSRQMEIYTTVGGYPYLDFEYTVFGQVVEGIEVVDKIAALKTALTDRPEKEVFIVMEIIEIPRSEVSAKYGYVYPTVESEN